MRSASAGSRNASASRRSAVSGVRTRWARSATFSRSPATSAVGLDPHSPSCTSGLRSAGAPTTLPSGQEHADVDVRARVVARCTDGRPEIVSATPAQGSQLDDDDGRRDRVHVDGEIDGIADDVADVEVRIDCSSGTPVPTERVDIDDD